VFGLDEPHFRLVADHLRLLAPRLEIHELPGAGHNAQRTQPRWFAELVRRAVALADAGGAVGP
jgi:pimeloyl-ACP methyl ester carboxylesterase